MTTKQIEQNAANEVRDYVDASSCLRSYLQVNDKTPFWDGTIFVYHGQPDKNENFVGSVKTQIKGTEVEAFKEVEKHCIPTTDLNAYMHEGGLVFFVVEMLQTDARQRKAFYKKLSPHTIQAYLKKHQGNKSIEFTFAELPSDSRIFEDELMNFINDARKQVSYVDKPGLNLAEALKGTYPIKTEFSLNPAASPSLALQLTSHPMVMYQDTPYASIPIANVELTAIATETHHETVGIGGKTYFQEYKRIYNEKTITDNIGDCLLVTSPKPGLTSSTQCTVEVKYPSQGSITYAINAAEFLVALKNSTTITFGDRDVPVDFGEQKEQLFGGAEHNLQIFRDMAAMWDAMQIPGIFSFDDFDEKAIQQYLDVVQHVYRNEPGVPKDNIGGEDKFYSLIPAGKLNLLILFTHKEGPLYYSQDAFAVPYIVENGVQYPLLTAVLAKSPDVLPDNIHYAEQLECYRSLLEKDTSFVQVVKHDLAELQGKLTKIDNAEKRTKAANFVAALVVLSEQTV